MDTLVEDDGDGEDDLTEAVYGSDPLDAAEHIDNDGDGLYRIYEDSYGTDPNNADTDGDGVDDYSEKIGRAHV